MSREIDGNSMGMTPAWDAGNDSLIGGERKLMVHTYSHFTNTHTHFIANRYGNDWSICILSFPR